MSGDKTSRTVVLACAAAIALMVSAAPGMAFPAAPLPVQTAGVEKVTFWGRPFPYRYNWSLARACIRYVPVETARGPVMRRVWVCDEHYRYASRRNPI
jgi:hypothetical protein